MFLYFDGFNVTKRCSQRYSEAVNKFGGFDLTEKYNLV